MYQVKANPARAAFSSAGKFSVIFGAVFFFYLISTILMVGGDGSAPGITHLTLAIMQLSVKVLHTPDNSGVVSAVLFFSSIFFVIAFSGVLIYRIANPVANDRNYGYGGHVFLGAVMLGMLILHNMSTKTNDRAKEQEVVLGVVKTNLGVIERVGVIDSIHVATWSESRGKIGRYQVYVRGKRGKTFNELYAVVDVSRSSGKTDYVVRCTNSEIGYFRPDENPCKSDAK